MRQRSQLRDLSRGVSGLFIVAGLYRSAQNMALTTLALIVKDDLGYGAGTIGVISALSGIVLVLCTVFISARLRTSQLERAVSISLIALAIALIVIGLSRSVYVTAFATLLLGVAGGLGMPSLAGSVQVTAHKTHVNPQRILALYTVVLSVSLALGPLLEAGLLDVTHQNVRWPFLAFATLPLLALVVMRLRSRETRSLATQDDSSTTDSTIITGTQPRVRLLGSPEFMKALLAQLMYSVPFVALTVFGAEVARVTDGATAAQAQLAFTIFFIFSLSCRALVAWQSPITRKGTAYGLSGVLTIVGLALIAGGHSFVFFLIGMIILGLPHGAIFPLALSALSSSLPAEQLPSANAVLMGSGNVISIAAPPILGIIATDTTYRFMMTTVLVPVVITLIVFLVIVVLSRRRHHSAIVTSLR